MAENYNFIIDLSEVKTVEVLHATLKEALGFPEYYGGNFDALHDCLSDIAVKASEESPVSFTFSGYKKAKRALESDFYTFRNVITDLAEEYPNVTVNWRRKA